MKQGTGSIYHERSISSLGDLLEKVNVSADNLLRILFTFNDRLNIMLTDRKGKLLFYSEYFSKILSSENNSGEDKNINELICKKDNPSLIRILKTILAKNSWEGEIFFNKGPQKTIGVFTKVIPVFQNKKIKLLACICMPEKKGDATEKELLAKNQELEILNEELDTFVYRSSHDLRAPITSILGITELIETETEPNNIQYYNYLIRDGIARLLTVTEDMENYSRNSRMQIVGEEIDVLKLIEESIDNHRYMENFHRLKIRTEIENTVPVISDKTRLSILINNMVSNMIRFQDLRKEFSYLLIKLTTNKDSFTLGFKDNGVGISEEHHSKIFEMFFRANAYSLGSGLGLYIVKRIVDKLGGEIHLNSIPDEGSEFSFTFPLNALKQK